MRRPMSDDDPEGADDVRCSRCGSRIVDSPVPAETTFVNFYVPATGRKERTFLCGGHGKEFRAWLFGEVGE